MKREVEWTERPEPGVKRKTRVRFPGGGRITWQFKRSDEPDWVYDAVPSAEDWAALIEKLEGLYNRRRIPFKELERAREEQKKAVGRIASQQ